jgi:hypothetical protein
MTYIPDAAWILVKTLSFGGMAVALAGVVIFGWYFIRLNAIAAQGEANHIPPESWRGRGAKLGLAVFAGGAGLQLSSFLLAALLPGGN